MANRSVFSTRTSWPRSIAAARSRWVLYALGARERMASFILDRFLVERLRVLLDGGMTGSGRPRIVFGLPPGRAASETPFRPAIVSVRSISYSCSPIWIAVRMTGRRSEWPVEDRICLNVSIRRDTCELPARDRWFGWISNSAHCSPLRSSTDRSNACSVEVRAPVSILAFIGTGDSAGTATHSRQPMRGRGFCLAFAMDPASHILQICAGSRQRRESTPRLAEWTHVASTMSRALLAVCWPRRERDQPPRGLPGLAPSAGFEPATPGLGNRCSIP